MGAPYPQPGSDTGPLIVPEGESYATCPLMITPTTKDPEIGCLVMYSPADSSFTYHYVQLDFIMGVTEIQCWRVSNQYVAAINCASNPCGGSRGIYTVYLFSIQQMLEEGPAVAPGAASLTDAVVHDPTFTVKIGTANTSAETSIIAVATKGAFFYIIEKPSGSLTTYTIHRLNLATRTTSARQTLTLPAASTVMFCGVADKDGYLWASSEAISGGNLLYKAHKINPTSGAVLSVAVGSNRTNDSISSLTPPCLCQTGGCVVARVGEGNVGHTLGTHYYFVNSACDTTTDVTNDTGALYSYGDTIQGWGDTIYRIGVAYASGIPTITIARLQHKTTGWVYTVLNAGESLGVVHSGNYFKPASFAGNFNVFDVGRLMDYDAATAGTAVVADVNGLELLDGTVPDATSNFGISCVDPSFAWTLSIAGALE